MNETVAYFITWTTYGSWLHGDDRGWIDRDHNRYEEPVPVADSNRLRMARSALKHDAVTLSIEARRIVEQTIARVCEYNRWHLHAVNCRTNHVHLVVTAADKSPASMMNSLKSWCSRELNNASGRRAKWWTRHGSTRHLKGDDALEAAIIYVRNRQ